MIRLIGTRITANNENFKPVTIEKSDLEECKVASYLKHCGKKNTTYTNKNNAYNLMPKPLPIHEHFFRPKGDS